MDIKNFKIGIISLGLIGGSIFKALKKHNFEIICFSTNEKTRNLILEQGFNASDTIEDLKICDLVFVCSPMRNVMEILDKLETIVNENTIVTDVCSLKEFVCKKQRPYVFIPSHPMAGKETSGFDVSDENLFKDANWVLTPLDNTSEEKINQLQKIIKFMGAKVTFANPQQHDEAVGLISHMPLVLSQALIKSVENNSLAKILASSGFRDMTRLCLSSTVMAQDMVEMNGDNIKSALKSVFENSDALIENYSNEIIEKIKKTRNEIYSKDGKNLLN